MWNLEDTERLVMRVLAIAALATALLLVLMTGSLKPERLSLTFAGAAATPVVQLRR